MWLDYLHSELRSNDLLDIIDDKVQAPLNLTEKEVEKRNSLVRDIIINHLDEYYHKKILNLKNPKEIITKIREFRNVEVNVTASSVRAQLYRLKMNKKEEVNEFCDKFDNIIREYESCDTSVPLSEEEKRSAFYQAVSSDNQELRSACLIRRQPEWQSGPHAKCFRCNKHGHMAPNCPLIKQNLWFCYYCNAEADHKGTNCPNKGTVQAPRGLITIIIKIIRHKTTQIITHSSEVIKISEEEVVTEAEVIYLEVVEGEISEVGFLKEVVIEAQEAQHKIHLYKEQQRILQVRLIKVTQVLPTIS